MKFMYPFNFFGDLMDLDRNGQLTKDLCRIIKMTARGTNGGRILQMAAVLTFQGTQLNSW